MLPVIPLESLSEKEFFVSVLHAKTHRWQDGGGYDSFSSPEKAHLLIYFRGCSAEYTTRDGRKVVANPGDIVYIPEESRYSVRFLACQKKVPHVITIAFRLYEENFTSFAFGKEAEVFHVHNHEVLKDIFISIVNQAQATACPNAKINAACSSLINQLSNCFHEKKFIPPKFHVIAKGILLLEKTDGREYSVHELAELCNVSDSYFRRLFKQYAGVSPVEYKLDITIHKAKEYLIYGKKVTDISSALGFQNVSYFCTLFKNRVGMTPGEWTLQQQRMQEEQKDIV